MAIRTKTRQQRRQSRKRRRKPDELAEESGPEFRSGMGNAAVQRLLRSRGTNSGWPAQRSVRGASERHSSLQRDADESENEELPASTVPLPIRMGQDNWRVAVVQALINQILPEDAPELTVDRIFGPRTDAAVRFIQWQAEIEIDGKVDDATSDAIEGAGADLDQAVGEVRDAGLLF